MLKSLLHQSYKAWLQFRPIMATLSNLLFPLKRDIYQQELKRLVHPIRVLYVSSYIPRKCGIATFTKDLTQGINLLNPFSLAQIMVMSDKTSENLSYPGESKFLVRQNEWSDYKKVIDYVNNTDEFELVCVQHEFGIYGKNEGENIVAFIKSIKKPVVTTFHTILPEPNQKQKEIVKKVAKYSKSVIVMLEQGRKILHKTYGVSNKKIVVIPHGVPDFPMFDILEWQKRLKLQGKTVMTSINLISENKGLEYAVESLPEIVKKVPNFVYLVVGQTHPLILSQANGRDYYREKLKKRAQQLGVSKHLMFVNRYVSLDELVSYIGATDIYITPYLDPQQATSGALAYAIGAGKACISTPYIYAKEMLDGDRGMVVPFKDSQAIARAVIDLCTHPRLKQSIEKNAYALGRTMIWANIARQYLTVFNFAIERNERIARKSSEVLLTASRKVLTPLTSSL